MYSYGTKSTRARLQLQVKRLPPHEPARTATLCLVWGAPRHTKHERDLPPHAPITAQGIGVAILLRIDQSQTNDPTTIHQSLSHITQRACPQREERIQKHHPIHTTHTQSIRDSPGRQRHAESQERSSARRQTIGSCPHEEKGTDMWVTGTNPLFAAHKVSRVPRLCNFSWFVLCFQSRVG